MLYLKVFLYKYMWLLWGHSHVTWEWPGPSWSRACLLGAWSKLSPGLIPPSGQAGPLPAPECDSGLILAGGSRLFPGPLWALLPPGLPGGSFGTWVSPLACRSRVPEGLGGPLVLSLSTTLVFPPGDASPLVSSAPGPRSSM